MATEVIGDPRFFQRGGPHALAAIAQACGARLHAAEGREAARFTGVGPLLTATAGEISFLDNPRYASDLATTAAGAVILQPSLADRLPAGCIGLLSDQPYLAWARACTLFYPPPTATPGFHPTALIDPSAKVDPRASIGPYVVIGAGVEIGPGCQLAAQVVIGDGVVIGADCVLGVGTSISHAMIGNRVRTLPGVRIGQEGFGFAPDGAGGYLSVPQIGRVLVHDDVEIGANTTIDRGSMRDTVIGAGTRIDNQVQFAHNVQCGNGCVIVAQVGISGSTILEDHVVIAGQAGLAGHLRIGQQARIGAMAGVMADVPAGANVVGAPAQNARQFFMELTALRRLAQQELQRGRSKKPAPPDAMAPGFVATPD